MLIILEGPDGAGKSTLGKRIEAELGIKYYHSARPQSVYDQDRIMKEIAVMDADRSRKYVIDRAPWISDPVYARVMRRPMLLSSEHFEMARNFEFKVLWCSPAGLKPKNISTENKPHKDPAFLRKVKVNHERIIDTYDQYFMQVHPFKWMKVDWQNSWYWRDVVDFINGDI